MQGKKPCRRRQGLDKPFLMGTFNRDGLGFGGNGGEICQRSAYLPTVPRPLLPGTSGDLCKSGTLPADLFRKMAGRPCHLAATAPSPGAGAQESRRGAGAGAAPCSLGMRLSRQPGVPSRPWPAPRTVPGADPVGGHPDGRRDPLRAAGAVPDRSRPQSLAEFLEIRDGSKIDRNERFRPRLFSPGLHLHSWSAAFHRCMTTRPVVLDQIPARKIFS